VSQGAFKRTLSTEGLNSDLFVALARGAKITEVDKGLYNVDGKFFIRTDERISMKSAPGGGQVLAVPVRNTITYDIIF
ncbi:MAG: hypothetical protein P8X57_07380, partial [Cyclobacteriaceae bacterium]